MKKRTISILLALTMVLSTASMCVFADENTPQDVGDVELVAEEQSAESAPKNENAATESAEDPAPLPAPNAQAFSAWKSVAIEWDRVDGANVYTIHKYGDNSVTTAGTPSPFHPGKLMYIWYGLPDDGTCYNFYVQSGTNGGISPVMVKGAVQPMTLGITMRQTKTLTSHDGSKTKYSFKKGQRIQAFGYAMGKYKFYYPVNGTNRLFYVQKSRIRAPYANYSRWDSYSPEEAEYFVYTTGVRSATPNLIFASLYTQHIYVMRNVGGVYRINDIPYKGAVYTHWEMASGTASTPSPSGFNLKIHKRIKRHSSARWWNCYHSMSAIHGKSGRNGYGVPRSHGCIRNPDPNAEFIYKGTAKGTRVIVY